MSFPYDKYPFINPSILCEVPRGWYLLVEMLCEEITPLIDENYEIFQAKEKYGELRWYDTGSPEVDEIIQKYSVMSSHICAICGKPDVAITDAGWIYPECRECYEKNDHHHRPYDEVVISEDPKIPDSYVVNHWTDDGYANIEFDISETVEEYRKRRRESYECT